MWERSDFEIVDGHAHIFPPLWEAGGFADAAAHANYQQRAMHTHYTQPTRRRRDNQIVTEKILWDAGDHTDAGRRTGRNFRAGPNGRMEWAHAGEDYYVQFMPPSLQGMECSAEFMTVQMDYVGVSRAVLQNDHIYGNLNGYFAEAVEAFPGRFIGLAGVNEPVAYRDEEIAALTRAVREQGMKGLYFTSAAFYQNGFEELYDDAAFHPFWDAVRGLGIPVHWVFLYDSPIGTFADEMVHFRRWLERYGDIPTVLVHGIPTSRFAGEDDRIEFPDYFAGIMDEYPVHAEVLFPLIWGGQMDYPYARAERHLEQIYDRFGSERLIWGSDMPNVERFCTYRQTLTYILHHCEFLTEADRRMIFGENILRLMGEGSAA
jgi:predicted TIM-barrel fold metal-dependent hydrolase